MKAQQPRRGQIVHQFPTKTKKRRQRILCSGDKTANSSLGSVLMVALILRDTHNEEYCIHCL